MPDRTLTPEEKSALDEKQLKKQLESYVEVAKHQLGRTPSLEDIQNLLGGGTKPGEAVATPVASETVESQAGSSPEAQKSEMTDVEKEPRIMRLKVYYGLAAGEGGEKKPDPAKILFYEDPDSGSCYDCAQQQWLDKKPNVLEHLSSRPVQYDERDIVASIANGVMEDSDYEALHKVGAIGETPQKLWDLTKRLKTQVAELEKSSSEGIEEDGEEPIIDSDYVTEAPTGSGVLSEMFSLAGVDMEGSEIARQLEDHSDEYPVQIPNNVQQIMEIAMARAMTGMEDSIREIVREEIEIYLCSSNESALPDENFEEVQEVTPVAPVDDEV
jgi:hypothetical protein